MNESDNVDFAEFGGLALNAYQDLFESKSDLHPPAADQGLVSDLLTDLQHYCVLHGVDFDQALADSRFTFAAERAEERAFALGTIVNLTGRAAHEAEQADLPARGTVVNVVPTESGEREYFISCPGDSRSHRFSAAELELGPAFSPVATYRELILDPLRAEEALVETVARLNQAAKRRLPPNRADTSDRNTLLTALGNWSGVPTHRLNTLLAPKYSAATGALELPSAAPPRHPARLAAAEGFPSAPDLTANPSAPTSRPKSSQPNNARTPKILG